MPSVSGLPVMSYFSVSIHEGVAAALNLLRERLRGRIELDERYDPELPRIEGHAMQLNQVWMALLEAVPPINIFESCRYRRPWSIHETNTSLRISSDDPAPMSDQRPI